MPPCMDVLKATLGTSRYRIVTAGTVALASSQDPGRCCEGMPIWSGAGGIILAADASSALHDDPPSST